LFYVCYVGYVPWFVTVCTLRLRLLFVPVTVRCYVCCCYITLRSALFTVVRYVSLFTLFVYRRCVTVVGCSVGCRCLVGTVVVPVCLLFITLRLRFVVTLRCYGTVFVVHVIYRYGLRCSDWFDYGRYVVGSAFPLFVYVDYVYVVVYHVVGLVTVVTDVGCCTFV